MRKAGLALVSLPIFLGLCGEIVDAQEDVTGQINLVPGSVINISVVGGSDPSGNLIGDYEFTATVTEVSDTVSRLDGR